MKYLPKPKVFVGTFDVGITKIYVLESQELVLHVNTSTALSPIDCVVTIQCVIYRGHRRLQFLITKKNRKNFSSLFVIPFLFLLKIILWC